MFTDLLFHELCVCALPVRRHKGLKLFLCVIYLCVVSQYNFCQINMQQHESLIILNPLITCPVLFILKLSRN